MSTYAIGDVQGCYDELIALLDHIHFNPDQDCLWFVGDIVNRGPKSLETLRFVKNLGDQHQVVFGNHDLHLLAVGYDHQALRKEDTLQDILEADDCEELLAWLRHRKFLHYDPELNFVMVHAGIAPQWDLSLAQKCANEVESVLQSHSFEELLSHMYGNEPSLWRDDLEGWNRYRFIINAFARLRYCDDEGRLDLIEKGLIGSQPEHLYPWFQLPNRKPIDANIVFGHWAALNGVTDTPGIFGVDTGCSWGYELTALRLEDQKRFSVRSYVERTSFSD